MIVLDASAVVELLLVSSLGRRVAASIEPPEITLHAPHLLDLEVAQTLRRYVRADTLAEPRAALALVHLGQLVVERYGHELLRPRIWALRDNLTAYDAAYVALAEGLGATLVTCDRGLANAPGNLARIDLVAEP